MKKGNKNLIIFLILIFLLIFSFFIYQLNKIPYGFFCDEALIAVRAKELLSNDFSNFKNLFFYYHFNYIYGILPVLSNIFFVWLFGLNEFYSRFSSVFFSISSLLIMFFIFRKQKYSIKASIFTILFTALTPIYFHLTRTNFGHFVSLFFLLLGYYSFLKNKFILSGIFFGISLYGYSGFVISTSLFIFVLFINIFFKKNIRNGLFNYLKTFFIFIILGLPLIFMIFFNKEYLNRLKDKDTYKGKNIILRINNIILNYPKYYSLDYLFLKGEIDLPGSFITRHSIKGQGEFYKIFLLFLILSVIFFIFDKKKFKVLPFFLIFIFYPLPDIITTSIDKPPYSFSLFSNIIFLPFLTIYGLDKILIFLNKKSKNLCNYFFVIVTIIFLFESVFFLNNYFNKYILYSSDYWGWQAGPREIINYFKNEYRNYDEFYMTSYFNEPQIFLDFYDFDRKYQNIFIGGFDNLNKSRKQLFAIRKEELNEKLIRDVSLRIKKIIYYPNGEEAFYIVSNNY